MAVSVLPSMPQAKKRAVRSASAPSARCISQILIQAARTSRPIRSSPCAPVAVTTAYPCICIRSVSGCVEISRV